MDKKQLFANLSRMGTFKEVSPTGTGIPSNRMSNLELIFLEYVKKNVPEITYTYDGYLISTGQKGYHYLGTDNLNGKAVFTFAKVSGEDAVEPFSIICDKFSPNLLLWKYPLSHSFKTERFDISGGDSGLFSIAISSEIQQLTITWHDGEVKKYVVFEMIENTLHTFLPQRIKEALKDKALKNL